LAEMTPRKIALFGIVALGGAALAAWLFWP
jgi:hypothetical protein